MSAPPIELLLNEAEGHVHSGRFSSAEACAASVLQRQPRNARAHYLLGLSALFQQRPAEALPHMEQAVRHDRVNAQYHFASSLCLAALGRPQDAAGGYRRALQFRPQFFEALANLGNVLEGTGRFAEAAEAYRKALALRPSEALVLNGLGVCELALGRPEAAVAALERATALRPELATALNNLATALGKLHQGPRAVELLRRAVALRPEFVEAWVNLGEQLYMARDDAGAVASFDRALELDPANEEIRYLRNAIAGVDMERAPDQFVANFFDRFAADFDRRLAGDLEYRTPQAAAAMLQPWLAGRTGLRVADLGCGTGLSGAVVRSHAAFLAGVDLSGKMLEQARARGVYDELSQSEIVAFLEANAASAFDLVLALDVFVYVGNLEPVMRACAAALAPAGRFVFSVERLEGAKGDFALARSGRYAHSRAYVERLAAAAGLRLAHAEPTIIRKEEGAPVQGDLYALEKG
jgi:predicted TPR repeat methyltransferase